MAPRKLFPGRCGECSLFNCEHQGKKGKRGNGDECVSSPGSVRAVKSAAFWFVVVFIGVGAYFANPTAGVVAGVATAGVAALIHPWKFCFRCNGTGKLFDPVHARNFRLCPHCGGRGRVARWFVDAD